MADHQETFDTIDSNELFESAVSDEPVAQAQPEPEPAAVTTEQPRGPDGKFAAKSPEPEPAKEPEPIQAGNEPAKDDANVPSWRVREINEEKRQALARAEQAEHDAANFRNQMAELQRRIEANAPKPDPVDLYADPDAWAAQQFKPFEQRMAQMQTNLTLRASRAENVAVHGREAVDAAEKAIDEAVKRNDPEIPALRAKLMASDDPVGVAIQWHKSQSLLKETGGDLNAYREKALEAALNDPAFLAKALERARTQAGGQARPSTTIAMPPSLNRVASAAPASDDPSDGSDEALFRHALG